MSWRSWCITFGHNTANYFYKTWKEIRLNVGRSVKLCRSQKGWTLAELATRTGIARSYLSMIENNRRDPPMKTMQVIANAFGMPLNVLIFLAADEKELAGVSE